ncbi:hypothetical protein DSO57_1027410 [Entomophthora muscae]|nr:hypothetical protein DSO57_1027410 [Entomophthora muscae]
MKLDLGNSILSVDASQARIACDQCRRGHRNCSKEAPTCARCLSLGIACTRKRTKLRGNFFNQLSRANLSLNSTGVNLASWAEVIELHPSKPSVKFYLRRYIIPLIILLPEPIIAIKLLEQTIKPRGQKTQAGCSQKPTREHQSAASIEETLTCGADTFFKTYNPFWLLFSEESFYSRPRSQTLHKIIRQIGLERMPTTSLVLAAMAKNGLTPIDLEWLPNTLDTLQCLLLVVSDLKAPWVNRIRFKVFCRINGLLPLLGLHLNRTSSPQWLERILAIYFANMACYSVDIQRHLSISNDTLYNASPSHLSKAFLQRRVAQGHFPHLSDLIIFLTRQFTYHIFLIFLDVNEKLRETYRERAPSHVLGVFLSKQAKLMEEIFAQGWHRLSCLTVKLSSHKTLLLHSRTFLAISYHYYYIGLMKTASFFPSNFTCPLYQTPVTKTLCIFSYKGLRIAIRNIWLVSTFTFTSYSLSYMFTLIPSITFILAYVKAFETRFGNADLLHAALSRAKQCLEAGLNQPLLRSSTNVYIELIDFFINLKNIPSFK